jgi:hypothetical protein
VNTGPVFVVPCSQAKGPVPAPAAELYTGPMFRNAYTAATLMAQVDAGRVLILSATHGLVAPPDVLAPYDAKLDRVDHPTVERITASARAHGVVGVEVFALLPRRYLSALVAGLAPLGVFPQDVFEGLRGIGDQRGVLASIRRAYAPN